MPGQSVPELSRKLRLLVEAGAFDNQTEVAAALGRSPITVRGWANGASGGPPDTVPLRNMPELTNLLRAALPSLPESELMRLLTGPADDLELALARTSKGSFIEMLHREADWQATEIIVENETMRLVRRVGGPKNENAPQVRIGQPFRIEVTTKSRAAFVVGLQSAPSGWGPVPALFDRASKRINLPGQDDCNQLGLMEEPSETGDHLFVTMQASRPFPRVFDRLAEDQIAVDRALLKMLQSHFLEQDKSTRRVFAQYITFTSENDL